MLIQKIIAERLSDKLQIMMVPVDGKEFLRERRVPLGVFRACRRIRLPKKIRTAARKRPILPDRSATIISRNEISSGAPARTLRASPR